MTNNTKFDEKVDGAENFRAWKYIIMLIFEERDLEGYIKDEVKEPKGEEEKAKHNNDMIKVRMIIANSIKDHFILHVSSKNTIKEIFEGLTSMFEGKHIKRRMNLRNQLKGVKIQTTKIMQSYFSIVYHIKEQIESISYMVEE